MNSSSPHLNIEIKDTPEKGKGLFATKTIQKDTFIIEYTGEVFHKYSERFKNREEVYNKSTHTYVYELDKDYIIDAT